MDGLGEALPGWGHLPSLPRWYSSPAHRGLQVPRFLDCEGPAWHPSWSRLRGLLQSSPPAELALAGAAPGEQAQQLAEELTWNVSGPASEEPGYHLFARRLARDLGFRPAGGGGAQAYGYDASTAAEDGFIADDALGGFCLYGLVTAFFVRAVRLVAGPTPSASSVDAAAALARLALEFLSPALGLDFLESSSWPVRSVDLRLLLDGLLAAKAASASSSAGSAAKLPSGVPWRRALEVPSTLDPSEDHHLAVALAKPESLLSVHLAASELQSQAALRARLEALVKRQHGFSILGLGDHATATLDVALMVRRALSLAMPGLTVTLGLRGLACPSEQLGRHHCRLKCHVLGTCSATSDALAEWIGSYVLGPDGSGYDLLEGASAPRSPALRALDAALQGIREVRGADLLVCAHPVSLCLMAFESLLRWAAAAGAAAPAAAAAAAAAPKPMLLHAASTLLYGAPGCEVCTGVLRRYRSAAAQRYLEVARELLAGPLPLVALAEGAVLSAQLRHQLGLVVPSCPALALYLDGTSYLRGGPGLGQGAAKRSTILVTRARFFNHPAGLFLRCLLTELAIANNPIADRARGHFWFAEAVSAGADAASEDVAGTASDTWKSWEEMSSCRAAFFIPSDIHQRTFIELYRMSVPTFMPDAKWFLRLPLIAPFGTFAYEGRLLPNAAGDNVPESFDAQTTTPRTLFHWYHYSDYAHFPFVGRCSSIPDLLHLLTHTDFEDVAQKMRGHYELLVRGATVAFAKATTALIG